MSLILEKTLIAKDYIPIQTTKPNIIYKKKYDECSEVSIKKKGDKYKVTFPLKNSPKSFTTELDSFHEAHHYLYDIIAEEIV